MLKKETMIRSIDAMHPNKLEIDLAADLIRQGGTVVFPTETVYGIGASIHSTEGIRKIFEAKGRPSDNPLIVHVASLEMMHPLVKGPLSPRVISLIESFWPGPLTLILEKSKNVPDPVTANLDTVAVRMPRHPVARALIEAAGVPIAAPSANLSGKSSATRANHVIDDLNGRVDAILCSDGCEIGLESTVLDLSGDQAVLLRPGIITKEEIENVIGNIVSPTSHEVSDSVPRSPGMKYTHYAPKAPMLMAVGDLASMTEAIHAQRMSYDQSVRIGILCTDETIGGYTDENLVAISLGSRSDLRGMSSRLFSTLRSFDESNVDLILAESFPEVGIGEALMNRLRKACGNRILNQESTMDERPGIVNMSSR